MAKVSINNVSSGFHSKDILNTNFDTLAAELNDKVLYRVNPTGEANQMENDIDLNNNDLLNAGLVSADDIEVGGVSLTTAISSVGSSVTAAQTAATSAEDSATSAASSASSASTSASSASTSASLAATSATSAGDSLASVESIFAQFQDVYLGTFTSDPLTDIDGSALEPGDVYWNSTSSELRFYNGASWEAPVPAAATSAAAALVSETNAATSEANAATSETNAATSESNASTSATSASSSATSAASSASSASTSATTASTAASNAITQANAAATSASNAATSETNAASSASSASTSETNAASSASAAATSESNASTSASNAATSETNTAALYDLFDDRMLGTKTSDPTLDNDGNALVAGTLYWNTSTSKLRIYNGSIWEDTASAGGVSGTVTSVDMTVPTGLTVSGNPITGAGTLTVTYTTGYSIPTTTNQSNWTTAYNWGNHASAGYLTSESDPIFASSPAGSIIAGDITNWNTAYGWGNHASAGYLTSLTGAVLTTDIGTTVQAYDADIPTVSASQAEMEAGTETALRSMSPLGVAQAIAALGSGGGGVRIKELTSGTTYTPPSDVVAFLACVCGSLGSKSIADGGIGGAGYSEKYYASPSGSYSYAIGAAGAYNGFAGGTTTFDTISVTGSAGVTTTSGSAGGVGSGGDFNATGGTGGNSNGTTSAGGAGGNASRAGNGGNGGNAVGSIGGGGGGTGGNNASGTTGGSAATVKAAGAYDITLISSILNNEAFTAGVTSTTTSGGKGADSTSVYSYYPNITFNSAISKEVPLGATSGQPGIIYILEVL